jgi:hypothetical protein
MRVVLIGIEFLGNLVVREVGVRGATAGKCTVRE